MADPGDADVALLQFRIHGFELLTLPLGEKRGDYDFGEEVSFVPSRTQLHVHMMLWLARSGFFAE